MSRIGCEPAPRRFGLVLSRLELDPFVERVSNHCKSVLNGSGHQGFAKRDPGCIDNAIGLIDRVEVFVLDYSKAGIV